MKWSYVVLRAPCPPSPCAKRLPQQLVDELAELAAVALGAHVQGLHRRGRQLDREWHEPGGTIAFAPRAAFVGQRRVATVALGTGALAQRPGDLEPGTLVQLGLLARHRAYSSA